ncbi:MAG TPA: hypothetical protein ENJ21_01270 [Chromatiaceae bacterium]|nr:hypothetical protein [Chromatiaceae bacterium]
MKYTLASTLMLLPLLAGAPLQADTLLIETIANEPPNSPQGLPRPTRGMRMSQVERQYGEPVQRLPAVGHPPITRWKYPKYTVYFEYQYVIDTVINRDTPTVGHKKAE